MLGLVTSKRPELESKDEIKRRLEAASKYVPMEQLCLSPQCGFSSTVEGNSLTIEEEKAKLRLVVEVADEVWGGGRAHLGHPGVQKHCREGLEEQRDGDGPGVAHPSRGLTHVARAAAPCDQRRGRVGAIARCPGRSRETRRQLATARSPEGLRGRLEGIDHRLVARPGAAEALDPLQPVAGAISQRCETDGGAAAGGAPEPGEEHAEERAARAARVHERRGDDAEHGARRLVRALRERRR